MTHRAAIVTLAIGRNYLQEWQHYCESNWGQYASKHGYDLICIDRPLDTTPRGSDRSPTWQKCLILSQDFSTRYERIIWLDADILINSHLAPDILDGVAPEKVGAVAAYSTPSRDLFLHALLRMYEYWESRGVSVVREPTPEDAYRRYGPPLTTHDEVVQAGVLVLSPRHHRDLLERVYYGYEPKTGPEWSDSDAWGEMKPLSHELLKAQLVHWIDHRFNQGWIPYRVTHYPFLEIANSEGPLGRRLRNRAAKLLGLPTEWSLRRACATAAFLNSYFLHFAGDRSEMGLVDLNASSWKDCQLSW
jgi:hypothetical protein